MLNHRETFVRLDEAFIYPSCVRLGLIWRPCRGQLSDKSCVDLRLLLAVGGWEINQYDNISDD